MSEYCFELKLKGEESTNDSFKYCLDLTDYQQDNPNAVFSPMVREEMRRALEAASSSKISDISLNKIVRTWVQDIEEGYRRTTLTLDLASLISDQIQALEEFGNQQPPDILSPEFASIGPHLGSLPPLNFI